MTLRVRVICMLIAAGVAAYLLVASTRAHSATEPTSAAEQGVISRVAAFRRGEQQGDAIPGATALAGITRRIGPAESGHDIWASLSSSDLCVQLDEDGASACLAPERFVRGPLIVGASRSGPNTVPSATPPPPQALAGVAPDGITSVTVAFTDGTSATADVTDNGFYIDADGRSVKRIDWSTVAGEQVIGREVG